MSMCSWFSEESKWELVQRKSNTELRASEEKSDVRQSDESPMGPMRAGKGLGRGGGSLYI